MSKSPVRLLDDDTKRQIQELAEQVAALERAKIDAIANQDFHRASQLRDKEDEKRTKLAAIDLPAWARKNIERLVNPWQTKFSRHTVLDMILHDEVGEPDPLVLAMLPNPLMPPVKIAVGIIPRFPVSTLEALLLLDDICSPYFHAIVPLISPESVARAKKDHNIMVQAGFNEIRRAGDATWGRPVLLCVVRSTLLSQDVRDEVFAGIHRTNCQFVVFEESSEIQAVLGKLPPGTKLLGV
jgi:hypothetical protein